MKKIFAILVSFSACQAAFSEDSWDCTERSAGNYKVLLSGDLADGKPLTATLTTETPKEGPYTLSCNQVSMEFERRCPETDDSNHYRVNVSIGSDTRIFQVSVWKSGIGFIENLDCVMLPHINTIEP